MNIPILYEDDHLCVINKAAGMVVNRADSVKIETIEDWAERRLTTPLERAGIVHRIDKETSGCLILAKDETSLFALQAQFKERVVKKIYLAIAHGRVEPPEGSINAPVGRLPWNREHFGIVPGGKEAVTGYKVQSVVSRQSSESFSVVELYPETGRTHQIRVHLKYINHPIVGDYLYAGRKTSRDDRVWAPRVMLHAWKIRFLHPSTHQSLAIEAPIPQDMNIIINNQ